MRVLPSLAPLLALVSALGACNDGGVTSSGPRQGPSDMGDGSADVVMLEDAALRDGAPETDASAPDVLATREHGVLRRECGRSPFGSDYLLIPTPTDCGPQCSTGTACSDSRQCQQRPLGSCVGLLNAHCEYADRSEPFESCTNDADCTHGDAGHCTNAELRYTFCLYDACQRDEDCGPDRQCQCAEGALDRTCVTLGCDVNEECGADHECREDLSIDGIAHQRHCSTDQDECASDDDCVDAPFGRKFCGFDDTGKRWVCRDRTIVDI